MTWPVVPLAEVAEIQGGVQKQPRRAPKQNVFPFLRVANVTSAGLDLNEVHEIELFDGELDRLRLRRGDLLVVEGNGSASQIGRAAVWDGSIKDAVHQNHLIRVRPRPALDQRFLGLLWNSPSIRDELSRVASSTSGLHTLSVAKLKRIALPLPPVREQRRIVDLLEDHLSRLDAGDAYLKSARRRLLAMERGVLAELHRGPAKRLDSLAIGSGYGTSEKCVVAGPGVPVVRIPNLVDGSIDLADEKRVADAAADVSGSMLFPGDLLIVRTNGSVDLIGRSAVVQQGIDAAYASYLIRYRLVVDLVRPEWVQAMLSAPQVRRRIEPLAASSAGQHNLSLAKLNPLELPVPSLAEQDSGLARLADLRETSGRMRAELDAAERRCTSLRRSLLAAAFSGRLTGDREFAGV
jgi:type I restriction enzyme S subunit